MEILTLVDNRNTIQNIKKNITKIENIHEKGRISNSVTVKYV